MSDIKVGDVVELKSGSPRMTVGKIVGDQCTVLWFGESNEPSQSECPIAVLVKRDDQA